MLMGSMAVMITAEARLVRVCWKIVIGSGHGERRPGVRVGIVSIDRGGLEGDSVFDYGDLG